MLAIRRVETHCFRINDYCRSVILSLPHFRTLFFWGCARCSAFGPSLRCRRGSPAAFLAEYTVFITIISILSTGCISAQSLPQRVPNEIKSRFLWTLLNCFCTASAFSGSWKFSCETPFFVGESQAKAVSVIAGSLRKHISPTLLGLTWALYRLYTGSFTNKGFRLKAYRDKISTKQQVRSNRTRDRVYYTH